MSSTACQALDQLVQLAASDGSWAYHPNGTPQVEPTCFALLALSTVRSRLSEHGEKGLTCLRQWQSADGAFRIRSGRDEAVWPTALALFTLKSTAGVAGAEVLRSPGAAPTRESDAAIQRAAAWLLATKGKLLNDDENYRQVFDIDPEIVGWPWTEETFSWTEPTSWACLALQRAGFRNHPRVIDGLKLLLDRALDAGGVNSGNRKVFDRPTDPVPINTALMLLAFVGHDDHDRLEKAREYLLRLAETDADLEQLCWIKLALRAWRITPLGLTERIETAYNERKQNGLFRPSPIREALTALALTEGPNHPFTPMDAEPASEPSPPKRSREPWTARIGASLRGFGIRALGQLRGLPNESPVHIASAASYEGELASILREQYESFRATVPLKGKRVVLKPNLVEYHRDKVINTHAHVVAAAIELCRQEGAKEIIVAEGPGHWRNTEYLVNASGLGDVLRHYNVPFIDLNHDDPVKTINLGRRTKLEFLYLSQTIATADVLISMPKMKTHHWAGVTLSLKNLFGTMPGICYGWPKNELHWRGIENSIVDIALTRTPDLAIVDGIIGMEGDGPLNGTPKPLGVLVMGTDLVAVDATCCRLMQLNPEKVGHLALGQFMRLGNLLEAKIKQLGETITDVSEPFATLTRFETLHAESRKRELQLA